MDIIIKYFKEALAALLALFGVALDKDFTDNLDSMAGGLQGYVPETDKDSIKL